MLEWINYLTINELWVPLELDKVIHFMWILLEAKTQVVICFLLDRLVKTHLYDHTFDEYNFLWVWWMSYIVESSLHCIVLPYFNLFLWGTLYESAFQQDNLNLEQCKTSCHQMIGGKEIGNKYPALLLPYGAGGLSEGPPNAMQMLDK